MSENSYQLAKQGSEIDSILANAAADHNKIGAASGIAPLGADGKVPDANLPSYAPLGADGKVPAANLPDNDATLRFSAVERVAGATITDGTATGSFEVVWLDNRALPTSYTYSPPTAEEKEVQGRFVAKTGTGIQLTEASGGDVSTTTYYSNWAGRDKFCNSAGKPLKNRLYLCTATGRQYDKFPGNNSTGLRCIAAPPMDAKKALLADLWNEACCNEGWSGSPATRTVHGYYDPDTDKWLLNGLTLAYDEAIRVYVAGIIQGTPTGFYWSLHTIRTNMPPRLPTNAGKSWNNTFQGCTNLEVANMGSGIVEGNFWIYGCSKIKKIIGDMRVLNVGVDPSPLSTVPLEEMHLTYYVNSKAAINLKNLPNLNADSLQWMVSNAHTTTQGTRTVTLHADAYARLTDDMKALAAEKSITFVCAS